MSVWINKSFACIHVFCVQWYMIYSECFLSFHAPKKYKENISLISSKKCRNGSRVLRMMQSIQCDQISRMVPSDASGIMTCHVSWAHVMRIISSSHHHRRAEAGLDIFTSSSLAGVWSRAPLAICAVSCNCKVPSSPGSRVRSDHRLMSGAPVSAGHSHPRHQPGQPGISLLPQTEIRDMVSHCVKIILQWCALWICKKSYTKVDFNFK